MLRNYLAAALRNLVRNKLYAAINIVGLAVGFAATLLIVLFVRDEVSFDAWIPGHENVVRLAKTVRPPGGATLSTVASGPAEAAWFEEGLANVIAAVRLWPEPHGVRAGEIEANETVVWADPTFFTVFPLPALAGDLQQALQQPGGVVITREMARKYFGRDHVVGETLELDRTTPLRVSAVLGDFPSRTHLKIDIIASSRAAVSPFAAAYPDNFGLGPVLTYLRLAPGTLAETEAEVPSLIERRVSMEPYIPLFGPDARASDLMSYEFQSLSEIHTLPQKDQYTFAHYGLLKPSGDGVMAGALLATGGLILLIAVANFVNLMTARASRRAVEVGVRKASGARVRHLMVQFMGESFLYVGVGLVAAVALVDLFLPSFNGFLDRDIAFDFGHDPWLMVVLPALLGGTGVLGGLYPALVLSRFRPAAVLKGDAGAHESPGPLRPMLVIAQFTILIGLIVATAVIGRQTTFAMASGFKLDTDQLLLVSAPCDDGFKDRIAVLAGVRGAACAGDGLLGGTAPVGLTTLPDGTQFNLFYIGVDAELFDLYGLEPVAGRFFSAATNAAAGASAEGRSRICPAVINETAVRKFGFTSPESILGQSWPDRGIEVVGVVADFPTGSMRQAVEAAAFCPASKAQNLVIKLDGTHVGETLQAIDQIWEERGTGRPIARRFYDQHVQTQYLDIIRQTQAFSAFSLATVVIAALGLFGLSAFAAEQRTKEIGIRKAMGASRADILRLLLWQFTKPVLWANVIAWPVAYFVMRRWLEGFAYHIDLELWVFVAASALALAIALLTVIGHALLVARSRPVEALRYE